MSSIGDLLLKLRGITNPTGAMVSSMLQPGGQPAGGPTIPGAPTAGAGVATPAGGSPTPPLAQAYQSPPDLVSLYNQLSDFQSREKRVDSGLSLLGGAVVQPRNSGLVAQAFGGNNSSAADPLSLIMQLQGFKQQQDATNLKRQEDIKMRAALPVIADKYGLDPDTAQLLYDNGQLGSFIQEAAKPNAQIVTDDATGRKIVVDTKTGKTLHDLGGGLKPTSDMQEFQAAQNAGQLPPGIETLPEYLSYVANLKKPVTNVNVDTAGNKFVEGMDANINSGIAAAGDSAKKIGQLQSARRTIMQGINAGSVISPVTNEGRKIVSQIFGFDDKTAANSDLLMAQMKNVVLPMLKELRPVSDTDLSTVEGIVGGTLQLTPETINKLIDIQEKVARQQIIDANTKAQKRIDGESDAPMKQRMQSAFDAAKTDVPAYDDAYMSHVDPGDAAAIKKEPTPANIKQFDDMYGPGVAEQLLGSGQ